MGVCDGETALSDTSGSLAGRATDARCKVQAAVVAMVAALWVVDCGLVTEQQPDRVLAEICTRFHDSQNFAKGTKHTTFFGLQ